MPITTQNIISLFFPSLSLNPRVKGADLIKLKKNLLASVGGRGRNEFVDLRSILCRVEEVESSLV